SLRLNLRPSALPSIRSTRHEESRLSQPALPFLGKERHCSHHSPRFLHDQVGEASALPMPGLWEDVLLDNWDTLLLNPSSVSSLTRSPPSVSKASISLLLLEQSKSPGIQFIAGWKEQPLGVADLVIEKLRAFPLRNLKPMRSEQSSEAKSSRSGSS